MSRRLYMTECEHKRIIEACSEDYVRMMRNWRDANRGGGVTASSWEERVDNGGGWDDPPFVLDGAARDVDEALADSRVAIRYREAVRIFWSNETRPQSWFAMRFGMKDETAARDRIVRGNEEFRALLLKRRREAAERRDYVARISAGA
jgi:hypothetical protein